MNIMSGYGIHIRPLNDDDIKVHSIDLEGRNPDLCIAVEGEDLGPALCAVIELDADSPNMLVWSSVPTANGDGDWHEITDETFAGSLARVVTTVIPEVAVK